MSTDAFTRQFTVDRVLDGDTFVATVDLGYHMHLFEVTYRIARVNAPEMGRKDSPGRPAALAAKDYTIAWLGTHVDHNGLFATSVMTDDWRRYLAEIECGAGHNLSTDLLESGHATLYKGGRR